MRRKIVDGRWGRDMMGGGGFAFVLLSVIVL